MKIFSFFIFFLLFNQLIINQIASQENSKNEIFQPNSSNYQKVTARLDSLLRANQTLLNYSNYSISIYSLNNEQVIYSKNSDNFVKPASITKLITTFVTYSLVGDTFQIKTKFFTNDKNIEDKVINGNLYIRGYGDCTQKLEDLDEIVRQLKSLDIKKITGDIIADGTFFDETNNRFHYSGDNDEVEPTALITALSHEKNHIKIIVNTKVAGEPKVQIIPYSPSINVVINNLGVPDPPKKKANRKKPIPIRSSRPKIFSKLDDKGYQTITISGKLAKNTSLYFEEFNRNPVLSYAGSLYYRLINNGIAVDGNFTKLNDKKSVDYNKLLFLGELSIPINTIINEVNKKSNNYYAENLFKFNAAYVEKDVNLSISYRLLLDSLIGINFTNHNKNEIKLFDGSGLSRRNRLSASLIIDVLKQVSKAKYFRSFLSSLAVAGRDGTLEKRMRGTNAEQKVFAKTGTHRDVSALSGIVQTNDGEIFLFAFLFNGGNLGGYKLLENQMCEILASYKLEN